jgi:hypothetical protein
MIRRRDTSPQSAARFFSWRFNHSMQQVTCVTLNSHSYVKSPQQAANNLPPPAICIFHPPAWEKTMKRLRASLRAPIDLARNLIADANGARLDRVLIAGALLAGAALAIAPGSAEAAAPVQASCHLQSPGGQIKRVVFIIFDNVHLRRDNPNVPSDLEQMPNLLSFLQGKGVITGNHFTPLIPTRPTTFSPA